MVDSGIKKATIKNQDLPYIRFDNTDLFYDVRYRILTDDKNRVSGWSAIKRIIVPKPSDADLPYTLSPRITLYTVNTGSGGKGITTTWTFPQNSAEFNIDPYKAELERQFSLDNTFDIFIRWSPNTSGSTWDPWKYETTISTNTYSLLRQESPYTAKRVNVVVQLPTLEKIKDSKLELFNITDAV
jgi:hypothetical protein